MDMFHYEDLNFSWLGLISVVLVVLLPIFQEENFGYNRNTNVVHHDFYSSQVTNVDIHEGLLLVNSNMVNYLKVIAKHTTARSIYKEVHFTGLYEKRIFPVNPKEL
ncbi:hypothetical protein K501DRAFT_279209 [Backusella circina FSU 941]|nr:hypothetical protein K501DRAFT_279209 [Backusella circina FSU 941]